MKSGAAGGQFDAGQGFGGKSALVYTRGALKTGDIEMPAVRQGRGEAMPFQAYASYFSLEQLKAMSSAYAAALNDLSRQMLTVPPDKVPGLKGKLAQLILASACNRKRDADELKDIALRGFRTVRRGVGYSNAA